MEEIRTENATNEKTNPQADTLIDLALADEQADETKGGPRRTISNLVMADGHDF